jgi:hypothetical protein
VSPLEVWIPLHLFILGIVVRYRHSVSLCYGGFNLDMRSTSPSIAALQTAKRAASV